MEFSTIVTLYGLGILVAFGIALISTDIKDGIRDFSEFIFVVLLWPLVLLSLVVMGGYNFLKRFK